MLPILSLAMTIGLYFGAKRLSATHPKPYLSPLILTPVLIILFLLITHISYESYQDGAKWLSGMLQPATIAFAVPLYKYRALMKKHMSEIFTGVLSGSILAVLSSAWIAEVLQMNSQLLGSLVPHSVTTPIAMEIAPFIGGIPSIAALFVIITGLLGALIGPFMIKALRIESEVARGVLFGTGAHAVGTAKAFEFSSVTGTVSSLSMVIAGIITALATPLILAILV